MKRSFWKRGEGKKRVKQSSFQINQQGRRSRYQQVAGDHLRTQPWAVKVDSSGNCYSIQTRYRNDQCSEEKARDLNSWVSKTSTFEKKKHIYIYNLETIIHAYIYIYIYITYKLLYMDIYIYIYIYITYKLLYMHIYIYIYSCMQV